MHENEDVVLFMYVVYKVLRGERDIGILQNDIVVVDKILYWLPLMFFSFEQMIQNENIFSLLMNLVAYILEMKETNAKFWNLSNSDEALVMQLWRVLQWDCCQGGCYGRTMGYTLPRPLIITY